MSTTVRLQISLTDLGKSVLRLSAFHRHACMYVKEVLFCVCWREQIKSGDYQIWFDFFRILFSLNYIFQKYKCNMTTGRNFWYLKITPFILLKIISPNLFYFIQCLISYICRRPVAIFKKICLITNNFHSIASGIAKLYLYYSVFVWRQFRL